MRDRAALLDAVRDAASHGPLRTFRSSRSPGELGERCWGELILTPEQVAKRAQLRVTANPVSLTLAEGLVSSADRLTDRDADRLPPETIAALGGPAARPGIFVLTEREVRELGTLNETELSVLKRLVNTRDVFAYGAILPNGGESLVYLPPVDNPPGLTPEEVRRLAFPDGMPALRRHLSYFEPILLGKTRQYSVRRPWWTIHNHRPAIARHEGNHDRWANYALTSRWGLGGTLVAGLAPRNSKPASGLHALMSDEVPAAYLVGLINSAPVQAIAESLPPGMMRQDDLMDLGLPLLDEARTASIATNAIAAADLVEELVAKSSTWPLLRDALRTPADLTATVSAAWLPTPGPVARWGRLRDLSWLAVEEAPGLAGPIQSVELETGIFGTGVVATGGKRQVHLRLSEPGDREIPNEQLAGALLAYVRGLAAGGAGMAGIRDAMAPVSRRELMGVYSRATTELGALMDAYRDVRARINGVVGEVI